MGLDKLIKREISITIAVVLIVTFGFIMFSYAIFKVDVSSATDVITFGDVALSFCANSDCSSTVENIGNVIGTKMVDGKTTYVKIYPTQTPTQTADWQKLDPYIFTLSNTGKLDLYLKIYLERDETPGLNYTVSDGDYYDAAVGDDQVMVAVGEKGVNPTPSLYSETVDADGKHVIAQDIIIKAGETKIFNLYAWLVSNAANASQGKYFVTQISARGEFIPERAASASNVEG